MKKNRPVADELPLLPLKDVVIYPGMVLPLMLGRPVSIAAVEVGLDNECPIFMCTQRDPSVEIPTIDDMYDIGVAGTVLQNLQMPDGSMKIVVEGMGRGKLIKIAKRDDYLVATVERVFDEPVSNDEEGQALIRAARSQFEEYARLSQRISPEVLASLSQINEPGELSDLLAAYLPFPAQERQEILATSQVVQRLEHIVAKLMRENDMLGLEQRVRERVREQMDRSQREHFLHEQLRVIHQELDGRVENLDESNELKTMIEKAKMPKEVKEKAERELQRFDRMPAMSPESGVIRTYIEWLAEMPWQKRTRDSLDIDQAKKVLDEDHYGLDKVKERILEFLAVRRLSKSSKGPVLCFVGPPGVGKTSLGRSIARAMGRKFVRVSLGGVRDEAEIRGHRRTYIGALPGRIVQSIKRAKVKNPVFVLDEIDKMSMDYRGDPSSALLEVLDPEQNYTFSDHYLEVDFDLQEVFFITTANSEYDIPPPLLDRMEVVHISGYTAFEKEKIARQFLIPKSMNECGIEEKHAIFESDGIQTLIKRYTREAGVRELERQVKNVLRKVARRLVVKSDEETLLLDASKIVELLGPQEYTDLRAEEKAEVGLAIGLAWTYSGGDILQIETTTMRGKGELSLTGQLGEVMRESAQAANTYLRVHADELGIPARFYQTRDIHVHLPEGAIPKDGPSAGITLAVSMLSALRNKAPRSGVAMTGEITLRGRILEVGAIKEKVLAAHRAGIHTVIIPRFNEKDLKEVPEEVRNELRLELVDHIDQVFGLVFSSIKPARKTGTKRKAAAK